MSKFVFIYRGGTSGASKEEQDKVMAAWGKWFEDLGDALVDAGNPFGEPKSVGGNVSEPATGYSIVNAKDHDAAVALAKDCPVLDSGNDAAVDVYEAFPM